MCGEISVVKLKTEFFAKRTDSFYYILDSLGEIAIRGTVVEDSRMRFSCVVNGVDVIICLSKQDADEQLEQACWGFLYTEILPTLRTS